MNALLRRLSAGIASTYSRFWSSETLIMLTMALLVGVGAGYGAVTFRWLIDNAHTFFFETLGRWLGFLGRYYVVILPALGGLLVGLLIQFVSPEAQGPGVSSVMEALTMREGRIRPIVIAARPVATSIILGSGGSAGREGPIVQMGAAIGSALSQLVHLSGERTKNLVAAGAAAGIAATFNAPLAGVMFALEVLLARFGLVPFTSVVVAAVTASVIGHAYFGAAPAFALTPSAAPGGWELSLYALLGVAAALVAVGFVRTLYWVDERFENWVFPPYLKPAAGGLIVGIAGLWFPQIFGVGYEAIEAVLFNRLTLTSLLILGILKIFTTSATIGSGGSGGIFAPSLFLGAMLGGIFEQLVHRAAPAASAPSGYVLVGMSAVFGAASRAPITAILTLFEMTRDYDTMLPLMLSTVISTVVARQLFDESIYTVKLSRRGIDVDAGRDLNLMSTIRVREAMTPIEDMTTVTPATPLTELAQIFDETHLHGLAVIDQHDRLLGVVTLNDLEQAQAQRRMSGEVHDIYSRGVHTVFPDSTLEEALRHFGALDVGRIPVVDRKDPHRIIGVLRRGDIVSAYSLAYLDEQARLAHMDRGKLERQTGKNALEIRLRDGHRAVGKEVQDLDLPSQTLFASIRRGGEVLIPRGDTRFEVGDVVIALVPEDEEETLRSQMIGREYHHSRTP